VSIIQSLINKIMNHSGVQCDDCKKHFAELTTIFTSKIGFKDVCDKCKLGRENHYSRGLNSFPSKIEFDKRRVI